MQTGLKEPTDSTPMLTPYIQVGGAYIFYLKSAWSPYYELSRHFPFEAVLFVRLGNDSRSLNHLGERVCRRVWFDLLDLRMQNRALYLSVDDLEVERKEATVVFEYEIIRPPSVNIFRRVK